MRLDQAPEPEVVGRVARWRALLAPLRAGDLRLVWLAQVVSQLGDAMFTIGVVWLTLRLTGSGLALSGTLIAQLLPYALLGAAAGALADRWDRRLTMVGSDIVRGVVVALIPLLDLAGALHAWMVPVIAFLLTAAGQFFDPARNALVPAITPEPQLVRVNALLSGTRQVLFIAGPAIGGTVVAAVGEQAVFWLDAVSFFLSAGILVRMRTSGHAPRPAAATVAGAPRSALWDDIREGLRFVRRSTVLRMVFIFGTLDNVLLSPVPVIIPLFFVEVLKINAAGFGSLLSVIFLGFLLGVALVGVLGARARMGLLVIGATATAGAAVAAFGTGPPLPLILVLGLVGGAAVGALEVAETTIVQRETTDEVRGRVFSLYESVSQGARAIAVALAGGLSEVVGLRWMFYGVGLLTLACAAALLASAAVRRAR
jgi:DHA3 family macrolide efflux protein-like MFS transporter